MSKQNDRKQAQTRALSVHPDDLLTPPQQRLGLLIQHVVPGCEELSLTQCLAFRAHCMKTGANPWRGEAYGYSYKGKFYIVDGYKWLTMWAQFKDPFTDDYVFLATDEMLKTAFLGVNCYILKREDQGFFLELLKQGADYREAREMATISAVGILHKDELTKKSAPHGWKWEDVVKKRALKNALNKSHGAPTQEELQQIIAQSGQPTFDELLLLAPPDVPPQARERYVDLVKTTEAGGETWAAMDEAERKAHFQHNVDLLRGAPAGDPPHNDPIEGEAEQRYEQVTDFQNLDSTRASESTRDPEPTAITDAERDEQRARAEFYRLASDGNGRMRTEAVAIVNQALGAKITWQEAVERLEAAL